MSPNTGLMFVSCGLEQIAGMLSIQAQIAIYTNLHGEPQYTRRSRGSRCQWSISSGNEIVGAKTYQ